MPEKIQLTGKDVAEATKNGISLDLAYARMNSLHWDNKKAITKKPRRYRRYPEHREKAKANGISARVFDMRISRGWDPEEACTKEVKKKPEEKTNG